jgi:hypothetical protein
MLKLTSFVFSFLLFALFSFAQTEYELTDEQRAYLEEFGTSTSTVLLNDDKTFTDDPSTWGSITIAPSFFGRPILGVIDDYLYIHTGQYTTSLAIALHLPTNTWVNSTPCTAPSSNSAFAVAHGELYKLSGSGAATVFEKFTPTSNGNGTWSLLTGGPTTVMNAQNSMVWDGGNYLYAYSGSYTTPPVAHFARYNITGNTWEILTGSPFIRRYAGMTAIDGVIYLIGGLVADATSGAICQKYDTSTNTWSQIASLPEEVNFTKWSVTTDGQYVFLVGSGGGFSTYPISDKSYYYDPATNQWHLESTLPAQRGLPNGIFLTGFTKLFFGGGNDGTSGTSFVADCWEGTGGVYIPVELTSFTAAVVGNSVQLNWSTASETNNMGFDVERSIISNEVRNLIWEKIGFIDGKGTTTEIQNYSFTDQNVDSGTYAYRLKQIDFDGTVNYSNAVEVDLNGITSFSLEQNYPNPFNPSTKISWQLPIASHQVLKVFDVLGNEVATLVDEYKPAGSYEVDFDAGFLSSGVYMYKLQAGDFVSVKKMLFAK